MQITKTQKIIISIVIIVVLFGLYVIFYQSSQKPTQNPTDYGITATSTNATTTPGAGSIHVDTPGSGYTITQVPITEGQGTPQPIPDLNRVSTPASGASISPEAITFANGKIKTLQTQLKANPANLSAWIDLGIYQKMVGDYAGSVISWKYASKLAPTDFVSLGNLGNIYAYFLNDKNQAESYYKKAIANGPTQSYLYTQLAEVYRDIFKDPAKAQAIVAQGLSKIPNDPNLLQLQSSLK